jgi:lethal(2) giant larvae protein
MLFLPGQGRLVTLTEDSHLHLWEINGTALKVFITIIWPFFIKELENFFFTQELKTTSMDGRLKQISTLCLDMAGKKILLGTEGGNIYSLNLTTFKIEDTIIYQDIVIQNSTEEFKVNPGAVESLLLHPTESSKILIGYARGLIVLWDREAASADQTYYANQQLESLSFRNDGSQFVSAHNDGSFIMWSTSTTEPLEPPNTPYGPYPCKAINKIHWANDSGTSWTMFSGGMPRASYGDKFTVTVMQGEEKHSVFDLTSKVIDFVAINAAGSDCPSTLLILAEEELAAVDLTADAWPVVYTLPYLNPIHASSITCINHVPNVSKTVYDKIKSDLGSKVTNREWPVDGGKATEAKNNLDVLISGHEDGSVKFWSSSGVAMSLMAAVKTGKYFVSDDIDAPREDDDDEEEDEWPPFKKIGSFDPFSDDPRLAVKKVNFCGLTGKLVVGGTAGQVVICELVTDAGEDKDIPVIKSDLVTEKEGFTWKGHQPLVVRAGAFKMPAGFQPQTIVQISPPASINSLAFSDTYGLVAAGTAHGLVILDSVQLNVVTNKCTLNAQGTY